MIAQVIHVRTKVSVSTEIIRIRVNAQLDGKDLLANLVSNWSKYAPSPPKNIISVGGLFKALEKVIVID